MPPQLSQLKATSTNLAAKGGNADPALISSWSQPSGCCQPGHLRGFLSKQEMVAGGESKPQIPHVGVGTLNLAVPWGPHRPHPTAPSPSTWSLLLPFPHDDQTQRSPALGGCSPGCRGGSVGSSPAPAPAPNSPGRDSAGMLHGHLGSLLPPRVSNLVFAERCHQCLQQTVSSSSLSRFRNLSLLFFFFFLI